MQQLRELHAPDPDDTLHWLYCNGCDFGGWEGERPHWPCQTAAVVYTAHEISEHKEAEDWWEKWIHQMRSRNPQVTNHRYSLHELIWGRMADSFIADKVFPKVSVERNEIKFSTPMTNISRQFLEDS